MHNTPVGTPVYHQQAFFNPQKPFSDKPGWAYREVEGRQIADHRYGIAFIGSPGYSFDQLRQPPPPPPVRRAWRPPQRQTATRGT